MIYRRVKSLLILRNSGVTQRNGNGNPYIAAIMERDFSRVKIFDRGKETPRTFIEPLFPYHHTTLISIGFRNMFASVFFFIFFSFTNRIIRDDSTRLTYDRYALRFSPPT